MTTYTFTQDERTISVRNPLLMYRILKACRFGGGPTSSLLKWSMRAWHLTVFCSSAFFNSPRGRWAMHALCELAFLTIYQVGGCTCGHVMRVWDGAAGSPDYLLGARLCMCVFLRKKGAGSW